MVGHIFYPFFSSDKTNIETRKNGCDGDALIGISVTTYLLERSITTFFIVLIYFNFLETHYPATQGWEGVIIWNCQAVNLAPRELMGSGRKYHLGYNLFIVYLVLS
jgi:hypothetical protein